MMDGMGSMMGWMMGFSVLGWVLVIALLVGILVVLLRLVSGPDRQQKHSRDSSPGDLQH